MIARAIGGIPVDRGSGSDQPLRDAEAALKAGEVVIVLPQGTIPRGYDFFDPVLHGKTGTARLAAATGATVVPVGLWGTEKVWPRSARRARLHPGAPPAHGARCAWAGPWPSRSPTPRPTPRRSWRPSARCCRAEARVRHEPTAEELARTKPPR